MDPCSVGMKVNDNRIQDNQISASSFVKNNYQPHHGRLDFLQNHGWGAGDSEF